MIRAATMGDIAQVVRPDALGIARDIETWISDATDVRAVEHKGQVIAVLGLDILWPGVGQVWMASAPNLGVARGRALVRSIKYLVREIMDKYDLHRLQTYVNGMSVKNQEFNELVGFLPESVMFMATPEKGDLIVYVCLRRQ